MPTVNSLNVFFLNLGAIGEQGASGNPGKDYIPHDFQILSAPWS